MRPTRAYDYMNEERAWRAFAVSASLAALAGGILTACFAFSPTEPFPPNAVPLAPPIQYGLWWQMVESCSGLSGDLATVRWYVQPGVETLQVSGISFAIDINAVPSGTFSVRPFFNIDTLATMQYVVRP